MEFNDFEILLIDFRFHLLTCSKARIWCATKKWKHPDKLAWYGPVVKGYPPKPPCRIYAPHRIFRIKISNENSKFRPSHETYSGLSFRALYFVKCPFCQIEWFLLTWSCGSRQRDTTLSGGKFQLNNFFELGIEWRCIKIGLEKLDAMMVVQNGCLNNCLT